MIEGVSEFVAAVVHQQPDPPRQVPLGQLLRRAYAQGSARWIVGIGGVLGIAGLVLGMIAEGDLPARLLILLVSGAVLVVFAGAPAVLAMRARRALVRGIKVAARVADVRWSGAGDRSTIDSLEHGRARGRRRVDHPAGEFTDSFETDSSWASDLQPGSTMFVLVDPTEPRVLFDLGPDSGVAVPWAPS